MRHMDDVIQMSWDKYKTSNSGMSHWQKLFELLCYIMKNFWHGFNQGRGPSWNRDWMRMELSEGVNCSISSEGGTDHILMLLRRKCINFHNRSCSSYQNVNRRLLSWVTVLSCYLDPNLVHRAGRVYSNVDPIYRLRKRVPYHLGPSSDPTQEL